MSEGLSFPDAIEPAPPWGAGSPTSAGKPRRREPRPAVPHEHFVEEPWVSRRLFEERAFGPVVVDPCAGFGNIVGSARACGLGAYGSDIVKRASGIAGGRDFLAADWRAPRRAGAAFDIVSNPPFGGRSPLLRRIAETACARAARVALLVPVTRLGPAMTWLKPLPLEEALLLDRRTSLWPGAIYAAKLAAGEKLRAGREPVVWLIFRRGHRGSPRLRDLARRA